MQQISLYCQFLISYMLGMLRKCFRFFFFFFLTLKSVVTYVHPLGGALPKTTNHQKGEENVLLNQ